MPPDLSDEDITDLAKLIKRAIDASRYPFSPEVRRWKGAARQAQTRAGPASGIAATPDLRAAVERAVSEARLSTRS
jgi:hypothetical protein